MKQVKKIVVISMLIVMATTVTALAWGGKSGDKNATGKINQMKVSGPSVTVDGSTQKGKLWLGYTVQWKDGYEKDYSPVRVKGKFSKTLYFKVRPQGVEKVTVALWRYKVSEKRCKKDNGSACQYCTKNGYHMEGRIDTKSGS